MSIAKKKEQKRKNVRLFFLFSQRTFLLAAQQPNCYSSQRCNSGRLKGAAAAKAVGQDRLACDGDGGDGGGEGESGPGAGEEVPKAVV